MFPGIIHKATGDLPGSLPNLPARHLSTPPVPCGQLPRDTAPFGDARPSRGTGRLPPQSLRALLQGRSIEFQGDMRQSIGPGLSPGLHGAQNLTWRIRLPPHQTLRTLPQRNGLRHPADDGHRCRAVKFSPESPPYWLVQKREYREILGRLSQLGIGMGQGIRIGNRARQGAPQRGPLGSPTPPPTPSE
jgi:hypothetical protein